MTNYETAALGLVLVNSEVGPEICGALTPEMLMAPYLGSVLDAMQAVLADRKPVDLISTTAQLKRSQAPEPEEGWAKFLGCMMHSGGVAVNLSHYLGSIKRAHLARKIVEAAQRIAADPENGERIEDLQRLAVARSLEDGERAFDFSKDLAKFTDSISDGRQTRATIDTGLASLDDLLGGLKRGDLCTVSARPGGGKTAVLTRIAVNLAERGLKVLVFSTETQAFQFVSRVLPGKSGVPAWKLRRGDLNETELKRIMDACGEMHGRLRLQVVDKPKPSIADVRAWVNKLKPDVLVLDYLQRFAKAKAENVTREVDRFMTDLKTLAVESKAVCLLGCQMNRTVDRSEGLPKLSDLRDGGAIESESDQVLLLHSKTADEFSPVLEITGLLEKNRHGATGVVIFELERELVNIRGARAPEVGEDKAVASKAKVPSHGLVRKDAMAADGYMNQHDD